MSAETEQQAIWVRTDPRPDGTGYMATIEIDEDHARPLNPRTALVYAGGILAAAERARYDASVARQLSSLGVALEELGGLIIDLRKDRPPLDKAATAPLEFEPGVNSELVPFIVVKVDGKPSWQWTPEDCERHAMHVLEVVGAADLDQGYYRALVGIVGLPEESARAAIGALGEFRVSES